MDGARHGGQCDNQALDPIDLTDDTKAVYPAVTTGQITADMGEGDLPTFTVADGDEYDAAGVGTIGSEIMRYTRAGNAITITARGVGGTEVATHEAGDTFQNAAEFTNALLYDVANTLFTAAGVPASMLPYADWKALADKWMSLTRCTHHSEADRC